MVSTIWADRDLELDSQGDLIVATGMDAVEQRVHQRLRFVLGEWFLQQDAGTPYRESVFAEVQPATAAQLIKAEILKVDGVEDVAILESDMLRGTRRLHVRVEVDTEFGRMDLEAEI